MKQRCYDDFVGEFVTFVQTLDHGLGVDANDGSYYEVRDGTFDARDIKEKKKKEPQGYIATMVLRQAKGKQSICGAKISRCATIMTHWVTLCVFVTIQRTWSERMQTTPTKMLTMHL